MQCPSCSSEVPAGARFCSSCGHALFAPADERRIVSMLFGDLVGFTSLSETADPEHVKNIVDRCFERLAADITSFGGRVDKIVGDAVVALFGAPVAHEDDAERAVRAALQMQRSLAEEAAAIGADLRMRIGINTGEVLVGALRAGGDYTAMGDVVNTASRLQTYASGGQVIVGEETFLATANVFRYESLGLLQARGRDEPVRAWIAHEALTAPGRRPRRSESPLVGRDAEVELLCSAFRTGINYRRPHLALLVGEAGMGKSRLAEHVVAAVARSEQAVVLVGRSRPYGEANVWWPIADALRGYCNIGPTQDANEARARCLDAVANALGQVETADVARTTDALLYLMGYEGRLAEVDPQRAREEITRAVRSFLEGVALQHPTLLVVSDVQWADEIVLELIDTLFERLHRIPLVVLLTARPELEMRWRPTPGRHNLVVLNLDPLDQNASRQMLSSLLGPETEPEVRDALIERSGGNPLFLEELVALLAESGVLDESDADRVSSLPATLRGLVAARLDSLPSGERAVLEDAAVLGRRGPVAGLVALGENRGAAGTVRAAVDALVAKELLSLDEPYTEFRSDLIREVAYGTLTKGERARRHANVGVWIETVASETERTDEFLETLARHYATSAELTDELGRVDGVPDDISERALDALERAAERAEDREVHSDSHRWWDQMLTILGDVPSPRRRHALIGRARAAISLRRNDEAQADLDTVLSEARAINDNLAIARAMNIEGELLRNSGRYDESVEVLEEALELWRALDDRRGEAQALRRLGMTHIFGGSHEVAEPLLLEALRAFQDIGLRKGVAWANQNLALISFMRGESDVAEERLEKAVSMFDDIGDWGGLGWARGLLAWVYFSRGMLREAEEIASKQIIEARDQGDRWALGMMTVLLASLQHWQGHLHESVEALEGARQLFLDINDHWGQLRAMVPLARGLQAIGQREEAELLLHDAEVLVTDYPAASGERALPAILGTELAIQRGDGAWALSLMDAFMGDKADLDPGSPGGGESFVNQAVALAMVGKPQDGLAILKVAAGRAHDVGPMANILSAYALVLAACGETEEAKTQAARVATIDGGTYLDRTKAQLAIACASAAMGDADGALAALDAADHHVSATDDELAKAITELARARVLDALGSPSAPDVLAVARTALAELDVTGDGWDTVFRLAVSPATAPAS